MTNESMSAGEHSSRLIVKWGGISLLAAAIILVGFVATVAITQIALPLAPQQTLEDPALPATMFGCTAFGEFLLLPGAIGLYFALKPVNRAAMLFALAIWAVAVVMFLVSRGMILTMWPLAELYRATTDPVAQSALVASATLALAAEDVYAKIALPLLALGSIVIGAVMLKSVFGKAMGTLTIVAGVLSLFAPFVVDVVPVVTFLGLALMAVWQLIAAVRLIRLGSA